MLTWIVEVVLFIMVVVLYFRIRALNQLIKEYEINAKLLGTYNTYLTSILKMLEERIRLMKKQL